MRLLCPLAEEKGLRLTTEVQDERPMAYIDRGGLNRILHNLVGNAIKFTDEGGITVRVRDDDAYVVLEVEDTGVGIDAAFLPDLFEEFKQESTGVGRSHEGSGLGLTITRRLVEMMYGTLSVQSEKGTGSTFIVTFPRAEHVAVADEVAEPEVEPLRLLVVDDNFSARLLLERMLRDVCEADTASNATEALALASETDYDLVLLDIHLSDESSGVEVMQTLRKREAYRDVPVIAFTAFALPGDRDRFLNIGFSDYLGKPFTKQQLFDVLADALGERWTETSAEPTRDAEAPDASPFDAPSATFLSG